MSRQDKIRIAAVIAVLIALVGFIVFALWALFRGVDVGSGLIANSIKNFTGSLGQVQLGGLNYEYPSKDKEPPKVLSISNDSQPNTEVESNVAHTSAISTREFVYYLSSLPTDMNTYRPGRNYSALQDFSGIDSANLDDLSIPVLNVKVDLNGQDYKITKLESDDTLEIVCIQNCISLANLKPGDIALLTGENQQTFYFKALGSQSLNEETTAKPKLIIRDLSGETATSEYFLLV